MKWVCPKCNYTSIFVGMRTVPKCAKCRFFHNSEVSLEPLHPNSLASGGVFYLFKESRRKVRHNSSLWV